ncbi:hypothetical protein [Streptococcus suis]|uniref:hypothetical protein n=1 Tax=Streptococcus suis TaxID=1307 RepID=UPI001EF140A9|nr:hypothetical protein [Streptococcus suis]
MRLTKRDYEVLSLLNRCRYATTKQLVELYFRENKPKTATRRANLLAKKLRNLGLIHVKERYFWKIFPSNQDVGGALRPCSHILRSSLTLSFD